MRTLIWFGFTSVAVFVLASYAAPKFVPPRESTTILASLAICLGAGLVALAPLAVVAPRWPTYMLQAGMAAMLIRLGLTIIGGVAFIQWCSPPRYFFMKSMVMCYLALLVVETTISVRMAKRYWKPQRSI